MQDIITDLKDLGLSDYEASIYSVLLELSPCSATIISKKCNLSRSSVYTTLSSLISKGLVGTTFKNEVKQFVAEDFSILEENLKKEKEKIEKKFKKYKEVEDKIRSIPVASLNIPSIVVFEGQSGLKKIYLSMLRQAPKGSTLYMIRDEFVWTKQWDFIQKLEWDEVAKRLKGSKNIDTKLIINNSKIEKQMEKFYKSKKHVSFKYLNKNKVENFAVYILGDMVSILSLENNNLVGVKITNKNIAENFKKVFLSL